MVRTKNKVTLVCFLLLLDLSPFHLKSFMLWSWILSSNSTLPFPGLQRMLQCRVVWKLLQHALIQIDGPWKIASSVGFEPKAYWSWVLCLNQWTSISYLLTFGIGVSFMADLGQTRLANTLRGNIWKFCFKSDFVTNCQILESKWRSNPIKSDFLTKILSKLSGHSILMISKSGV